MKRWQKIALGIFGGAFLLEFTAVVINIGHDQQTPAPAQKVVQTAEEKKTEAKCNAWLVEAVANGLIPPKQLFIKVNGEGGMIVEPLRWYSSSFEVKEYLPYAFECSNFKGRDPRLPLTIFDDLSHQRLGYYDGVHLTIP